MTRTYVIPCPKCKGGNTEEFGLPIPNTDDYADCVRCLACGFEWATDPAATASCTMCGGSGIPNGDPSYVRIKGRYEASSKCVCVEQ